MDVRGVVGDKEVGEEAVDVVAVDVGVAGENYSVEASFGGVAVFFDAGAHEGFDCGEFFCFTESGECGFLYVGGFSFEFVAGLELCEASGFDGADCGCAFADE